MPAETVLCTHLTGLLPLCWTVRGSGWTFEAIEKVSAGAESFFQQVLPDMLALDTALAEGGGRAEGEAGVVEQFKSNPVPRTHPLQAEHRSRSNLCHGAGRLLLKANKPLYLRNWNACLMETADGQEASPLCLPAGALSCRC